MFKAFNTVKGVTVAIKRIEIIPSKSQSAKQCSASLIEEITLLKTLEHERIVSYLDSHEDHQYIYIVLE